MTNFQPTHFIEQYRMCGVAMLSCAPLDIKSLNAHLEMTRKCIGVTVAVFKIQYKK